MSNLETILSTAVVDADMVSMYPRIMRAANIARMTLSSAVFEIEGKDPQMIAAYFGNLIGLRENTVQLCSSFHSVPSYTDMIAGLDEEFV